MTEIIEGALTFRFPTDSQAGKYDDWSFYRNQFQSIAGRCKAIDILCVEEGASWLIEVKDYRRHPRTKVMDIAEEVAIKVRDTLAGLAAASKYANDQNERNLATQALEKPKWRVVLHIELPNQPDSLYSHSTNLTTLLQDFRRKKKWFKAIDAHFIVCDRSTCPYGVPWTVR